MSTNNYERVPDPKQGDASIKSELLTLAKRNNILRISAEKGMSKDEAVKVIQTYSDVFAQFSLPEKMHHLLSTE